MTNPDEREDNFSATVLMLLESHILYLKNISLRDYDAIRLYTDIAKTLTEYRKDRRYE